MFWRICIGLGVFIGLSVLGLLFFVAGTVSEAPIADVREDVLATNDIIKDGQPPPVSVVVTALDIPWEVAFLPSGGMLVTERSGTILHVESGNRYEIEGVQHIGEGGLLGMALHPNVIENGFVYIYQTTNTLEGLRNRVVRYVLQGNELTFDRIILDDVPGARYHDGGRIAFGPDGFLYITVGDAGDEEAAQDVQSLAGSILRVDAEGAIPTDNPFGNAIYSYGHRNPQGLAWDDVGNLWSTEHGRSGVFSGYDELNRIVIGGNYGWPDVQGDETEDGIIRPAVHSGARTTWAPASAVYLDGSIYFGGLRGEALYEAVLSEDRTYVFEVREHFKGSFGRIRTVVLGPDEALYLTTSNRDGRGTVQEGDDQIIRVDPAQLQ